MHKPNISGLVTGLLVVLLILMMLIRGDAKKGNSYSVLPVVVLIIGIGIALILGWLIQTARYKRIKSAGTPYVATIVDFEYRSLRVRNGHKVYTYSYVLEYTDEYQQKQTVIVPSKQRGTKDSKHPATTKVNILVYKGTAIIEDFIESSIRDMATAKLDTVPAPFTPSTDTIDETPDTVSKTAENTTEDTTEDTTEADTDESATESIQDRVAKNLSFDSKLFDLDKDIFK